MRKHIPKLRQVSQVLISIPCDNIEKSFHDVRLEILKWAQRRAGHKLPRDAWEGNSFELDKDGAQPAEAIHLEEQGYYAFRLVYGDKKIPQRYWQTEATVAKYENEILLGMRLFWAIMGESAPFVHSVPGLVRQIVKITKKKKSINCFLYSLVPVANMMFVLFPPKMNQKTYRQLLLRWINFCQNHRCGSYCCAYF